MNPAFVSEQLAKDFFQRFPFQAVQLLDQESTSQLVQLLENYPPEIGVNWLNRFSPLRAAEILAALGPEKAKPFLINLESKVISGIFSQWESSIQEQFFKELPATLSESIRHQLSYPADRAASFMDPRVLRFYPEITAQQAFAKIRALKNRRIFDIFVVDEDQKLLGVVQLEQLVAADKKSLLRDLMNVKPIVIKDVALREEAIELFEKGRMMTLPVLNFEGRLLGVIRQSALTKVVEQEALSDLQTMVGAGSEERAFSKISTSVRNRLPWLQINLLTAFLAAAVVGIFEGTIAKFTALAVLLPVVAGQSGNTGAQALAVTLRGLTLREVRIQQWMKVVFKELRVGLINGIAVAVTTCLGVYFWSRSWGLCLVIAMAMIISMMAAGLAGAVIPLILTSLRQDPAQSSSIFLTTVTDIVGFLSFLGLATIFSALLQS